jgi:voltage-gated potassium channel
LGTLAVPTGIVTAELTYARRAPITTRTCQEYLTEGHRPDTRFCCHGGTTLPEYAHEHGV